MKLERVIVWMRTISRSWGLLECNTASLKLARGQKTQEQLSRPLSLSCYDSCKCLHGPKSMGSQSARDPETTGNTKQNGNPSSPIWGQSVIVLTQSIFPVNHFKKKKSLVHLLQELECHLGILQPSLKPWIHIWLHF